MGTASPIDAPFAPTPRHRVADGQATPKRFRATMWTIWPLAIWPVAGSRGTASPSNPTARHRVADAHATASRFPPTVPGMIWTLWPLAIWPVAGSRGTATAAPELLYPTPRHRVADGHATPWS